jgi:signal transduction histidine kinase
MSLRARLAKRLTATAFGPHLPRRTVRLRLTLIYGFLFLLSGAALLVTTNLLVDRATSFPRGNSVVVVYRGKEISPAEAAHVKGAGNSIVYRGKEISPAEADQIRADVFSQRDNDLHSLFVYSLISFGAMALLSTALGWVVAGRALRPLRALNAAAQDISATSLGSRLPLDGPDDELKELGTTFNQLLARLEKSFESQRRFVANASHELRSPLARQRAIAQVALSDPGATLDSLRTAHERVMVAGAQQERLIDALLTLARGEAGPDRQEALDLAAVVRAGLSQPPPEVEALGLRVERSLAPALLVGDPRLVERLVANLVDNAARYNLSAGTIRVATATRAGRAVLSVENSGPVVPPAELERLFQPFQRMAPDRTGHGYGVGLGLSIVQAIATAHGAQVTAVSRPEGGLRVEVGFPPAPDGTDATAGSHRRSPRGHSAKAIPVCSPGRTGAQPLSPLEGDAGS